MIELGGKTSSKHNSEYCDVILLLPLVGVNNYLTLLHMSKNFVYMNSIENYMNQFAIGFMVNALSTCNLGLTINPIAN